MKLSQAEESELRVWGTQCVWDSWDTFPGRRQPQRKRPSICIQVPWSAAHFTEVHAQGETPRSRTESRTGRQQYYSSVLSMAVYVPQGQIWVAVTEITGHTHTDIFSPSHKGLWTATLVNRRFDVICESVLLSGDTFDFLSNDNHHYCL